MLAGRSKDQSFIVSSQEEDKKESRRTGFQSTECTSRPCSLKEEMGLAAGGRAESQSLTWPSATADTKRDSWASDQAQSYTPSAVSKEEISVRMPVAGFRSRTWIRPLPMIPKF